MLLLYVNYDIRNNVIWETEYKEMVGVGEDRTRTREQKANAVEPIKKLPR